GFERAVKAVGPEMRAGFRLDQLHGDADLVAAFPDRAFEHVRYTKLAAHLLHINRAALVSEARVSGDYEEPADAGERGDDLLDHAVCEIFLARIAAQVLEGQYRDRRLVRQWQTRRHGYCRSRGAGQTGQPITAARDSDNQTVPLSIFV